jgi:hypothetical protein
MSARALAKAQAAIASSEAQARRYGELVKIMPSRGRITTTR